MHHQACKPGDVRASLVVKRRVRIRGWIESGLSNHRRTDRGGRARVRFATLRSRNDAPGRRLHINRDSGVGASAHVRRLVGVSRSRRRPAAGRRRSSGDTTRPACWRCPGAADVPLRRRGPCAGQYVPASRSRDPAGRRSGQPEGVDLPVPRLELRTRPVTCSTLHPCEQSSTSDSRRIPTATG